MRLLAGYEGGEQLLADRAQRHHPAGRAIALIRNRIEVDDERDVEPMLRARSDGSSGTAARAPAERSSSSATR
jgi:hypothetical protein